MKSVTLLGLFLAVFVASSLLVQAAQHDIDDGGVSDEADDQYQYIPREEGDDATAAGGERGEHTMHETSGSSRHEDSNRELAQLSKDEQLMVLEDALEDVRKNEVQPALNRVAQVSGMHAQAKANSGWIKSAAEKKRIHSLEQELAGATNQLAKAQSKEMEIYDRMKPLYGIVSYQFMQEQQATIQGSLKKMNKMAYDNAWWSSVFNSGRAESLTDLVVQFFLNWFMSYVIMYPFALAYYAFWSAPWAIYAYSSGSTDVVPGVIAWFCGVFIMTLPLLALGLGVYLVVKKYGPELARKAQEAQEERRRREEYQYQRMMAQRERLNQQDQQYR